MKNQKKQPVFLAATAVIILVAIALVLLATEVGLRFFQQRAIGQRISTLESILATGAQYNAIPLKGYEFRKGEVGTHEKDRLSLPTVYRPYIEWRRIPNVRTKTFNINSLSYRGKEFEATKKPGVFRILMYGGSFVWGTGALSDEETLPAHLEKILNERAVSPGRFEVINCGELGFCSTQGMVYLTTEGVLLDPDLVISIDGVNDTVEGYSNMPAGFPIHFDRINALLTERQEFKDSFSIDDELAYWKKQRDLVWDFSRTLLGNRVQQIVEGDIKSYAPESGGDYTPPEEFALRHFYNIRNIHALGQGLGFKSLACIQPVAPVNKQLHPKEKNKLERMSAQSPIYYRIIKYFEDHYNTYADLVADLCRDSGYPFLDLRPVLTQNPEPLFVDHCHLTGDGYKMMAHAVVDKLMSEGMVPLD